MKYAHVHDQNRWKHRTATSLALVVALSTAARGQTDQATPRSGGAESVTTTVGRLDAAPGTTVLLPLIPSGARLDAIHGPPPDWVPTVTPDVTIAGSTLQATVYRLDGRQSDEPARDKWLPVPREWTATRLDRAMEAPASDSDVAFWVLAVDLPDRPVARHIEVGARRIRVNWLDSPPRATDIARLPLLEAGLESQRALGDHLRREAMDPFRRWRCSIIADRFSSHALWGDRPALAPYSDPVIEAASRHAEIRARAAVEAACRLDPDLGAELLSKLTAVVRMHTDDLLPLWPSDESGTLDLFSTLLDPDHPSESKRDDVEVWLARVPNAIAWVVSDHTGRADSHAVIGLANLRDRQAICSAAPEGLSASNARTLLPHRSTLLSTPISTSSGALTSRIIARLGTDAYPLSVLTLTPVAQPPGIDLGPLLPEWTMATWLGVGLARPALSDAATARLFAEARQPGEDRDRSWHIFVEARTRPDSASALDDTIRIWCGPIGLPVGVITLSPSGASIDGGRGPEPLSASIETGASEWSALLDLPDWVIADDATLDIGLDRVDPRGNRSAWPRPMIPGQEEPARLRIDLSGWSPLEDR